jgi:hypothetical protein
MSESGNNSDLVNFTYRVESKTELIKTLLFNYAERQKNFYRLNTIVANECGKRCLNNFKTNKLSSQETMCLTVCTEKFYNILDLGEYIYNSLSNDKDQLPLLNGEFEKLVNNH